MNEGSGFYILIILKPIDNQKCYLTYESFNHNEDEVKLFWKNEEPILILKDIRLPDYELTNFSAVHMQRVIL